MKKVLFKKILVLALTGACIFNNSVFAVTPDEYLERAHIAHESTYSLSDGAAYTKSIIYDDKLGFQNMYRFDFDDTELTNIVFSSGEKVYSRNSMNTLAKNIDESEGAVIGGINADFFNMATGVPESAFIKNGVIYTSDRSSNCFARKADGSFFFGIPDIRVSMLRGETEYNIVFLNKELANNGIYMYTDKFSDETKIKVPTTEVVFYPYAEMLTPREIAENYFSDGNIPEDLYETLEIKVPVIDDVSAEVALDESVVTEIENTEDNNIIGTEESPEIATDSDSHISDDTDNEQLSAEAINEETKAESDTTDNADNNDDVSVENDISEADDVEQFTTEYTEVFNEIYRPLLDMFALDNGYTNIGGNYFILSEAEPRIDKEQNAVAVETRFNREGKSLPIPEGAYVLSSDNAGYGYTLNNFKNGETVTFKIKANEDFFDVTDAIGCGSIIVKDGRIVEDNSLSHYSSQQPRSAIGIKEDGSVVLFAVDGRNPGTSAGLKLKDLSAEMIRAGCVEAANFDGGGSTTVKVISLSDNSLITSNKPSDTSERMIANAVFITKTAEKDGSAVYSYVDTEKAFVMPNSYFPLTGNITYTDKNHYVVESSDINTDDFTYTAQNGSVSEEGYTPSGFVGIDSVISSHGEDYSNVAAKIISVDKVDNITLSADKNSIYPHENLQLDVDSILYGWKVYDSISEYSWGVSDDNGYIDEAGVYYPAFVSDNTELFAYFGDTVGKLTVSVIPYPFLDIEGHWSVAYCCTLYDEGVTIGELTAEGRMYFPERTYTRNEFCVMLSRIMGLTVATDTVEEPAEATSESEVKTIQESNIDTDEAENTVDGQIISEVVNADNETIEISVNSEEDAEDTASNTEEADSTEKVVNDNYGKTLFEDDNMIPLWAYESVCALYELGLLSDFAHNTETGMTFDGANPVTRREVMSVIGRLFDNAPEDYVLNFTDYDNNSSDLQFIKNSAYAGIIEGYEDGSLRPDGLLTRAEGAAVFTRILELGIALN